jgi:predicted AAA+ superfamily ATPase
MLEHMRTLTPFNAAEMRAYETLFMDYCILGGMPAVVKRFVESGNFSGTLAQQKQLLLDYEEDIRKYAEGLDQEKILSVWRHVPAQLARGNKKFQYSTVSKSARAREYQGCVDWLKDAASSTCAIA